MSMRERVCHADAISRRPTNLGISKENLRRLMLSLRDDMVVSMLWAAKG